jgi:hypothetical protein
LEIGAAGVESMAPADVDPEEEGESMSFNIDNNASTGRKSGIVHAVALQSMTTRLERGSGALALAHTERDWLTEGEEKADRTRHSAKPAANCGFASLNSRCCAIHPPTVLRASRLDRLDSLSNAPLGRVTCH